MTGRIELRTRAIIHSAQNTSHFSLRGILINRDIRASNAGAREDGRVLAPRRTFKVIFILVFTLVFALVFTLVFMLVFTLVSMLVFTLVFLLVSILVSMLVSMLG
jgi:hypothetical protein